MGPVIEELSTELNGKVKVCKVNVDDNPTLAANYNVMSIPMFAVFNNGKIVGQQIGAVGKETLLKLVEA